MGHDTLVQLLTPAMRSLRPGSEMSFMRALQSAINPDGTVNQQAFVSILPWQPRDFWVPGVAAIAADVAQNHRVRQPSRLVYLDAFAKAAPTGGEWQGVVNVVGTSTEENVSISAGTTSGQSVTSLIIPAGALLQLNVIAANTAEDVSVTAWLVPDTA